MDEKRLARRQEAMESSVIKSVKLKLNALRQRIPEELFGLISSFIDGQVIPALRKKYGDPKPFSLDPSPRGRLDRYKLYHILNGGTGYEKEPCLDLEPDLEGGITFEKFINDLYTGLIESDKS